MATPLLILHLEEVVSTQHEARSRAEDSGRVPLLLIADRQARGKGRAGRTWLTAPRALACSLVVAPGWDRHRWSTISLIAGLAARRALMDTTAVEPMLKWPNDIVVTAGKIGGILAEAESSLVVIGLGVNLWWPDPPEGIAAVHGEDPGGGEAPALAEAWAESVVSRLEGSPDDWGRDAYRRACSTLGTSVTWEPDGKGEAVGVAFDGGLIVETARGPITLHSGSVHTIRPTTVAPGDEHEKGAAAP